MQSIENIDYSSEVPQINPFLSVTYKDPNLVIASVCGKIKKLKCKPGIFAEILSSIDRVRTINELVIFLRNKYPEDFLKHFFSVLAKSEIIILNNKEIPREEQAFPIDFEVNAPLIEKLKEKPLGIIGSGAICSAVMEMLKDQGGFDVYKHLNIEMDAKVEKISKTLEEVSTSFLIVCPEKASYGWLLAVNKACLELNLPWILCYFNGKYILLGPTVLPWKSPCYACLIEHKLSRIYANSKLKLTFEDLCETGESWPFSDTLNVRKIARRVGSLILSEALRMTEGTVYPEFVKRQIRIPPYLTESFTGLKFETITTCPACYGLNRDKLIIGRPANLMPPAQAYISLEDVSVEHKEGGYRAASAEEALEKVSRAIKKFGASITIERITKDVLDKATPTYNSSISNFYKKDFPLLINHKNQWGKGITEKQAYLSGSFELFERICSEYYGNLEIIRASYREVEDIAINMERAIGAVYLHHDIDLFDPHMPIDWVWGYSLVKEKPILVPASMVYLAPCKFVGRFCEAHSGGLAAGTTIEDAILQGLMEAVEHDAWMIWQANAITTPQVRKETIDDPAIAQVIDEIEQIGFRLIIRYQTTDIEVPVFLTWLVNEKDYSFYAWHGYGANLDKGIALKRSITEANQSLPYIKKEENLTYMSMGNQDILDHKWSLFYLYHFNHTHILREGSQIDFNDIPNVSTGSITGDIKKTITLIRKVVPGADIVVFNLEQEAFSIPVVKVITVGLQNMGRPLINFPGNRLFRVPKALGYRDYELSYKELFNNRYPH